MNTPTPPLPSAVVAIREALAAGPTPGPWSLWGASDPSQVICCKDSFIAQTVAGNDEANAAFIAACNPVAIAALLERIAALEAERDRALRNRDMWKGQCERQAEQLTDFRTMGGANAD